ncbi:hypothetical protein QL285_059224 [Trifolium repens]|nr:hypothetical protein QL285_059224 [Trifolium repens]
MVPTNTTLIRKIKKMLTKGPDACLEEIEKFSCLVNKLNVNSPNLSAKEHDFIGCLKRLEKEMVVDAPLILLVEVALEQNHKAVSDLFEKIWFLKEDMRMYESNLAALFHEENTILCQMSKAENELTKLKMRITEIKDNIQEDVIKLLNKRRTLMVRKTEMRELGEDLSLILDTQKVANTLMQAIHNLWTAARDAGNLH